MQDTDLTVLTGDIVASSRMRRDELDIVMGTLARAASQAVDWYLPDALPRFTRFRGDGWQCLAAAPAHGLRTALYLRACLRTLGRSRDTRIAIGIGPGEVPADDLSGASGPAFQRSGHALDALKRGERLVLAAPESTHCLPFIEALLVSLDGLATRWTAAQARVLVEALAPDSPSQKEIGARLDISQQTVARHLRAAGEPALFAALQVVENPALPDLTP